ncbi:hypothetical protein OR1_01049 [Geobacter sp. OR-1]|nr:hypothetical protein OR1_01049 [Geobacter sp. OR-1]
MGQGGIELSATQGGAVGDIGRSGPVDHRNMLAGNVPLADGPGPHQITDRNRRVAIFERHGYDIEIVYADYIKNPAARRARE